MPTLPDWLAGLLLDIAAEIDGPPAFTDYMTEWEWAFVTHPDLLKTHSWRPWRSHPTGWRLGRYV